MWWGGCNDECVLHTHYIWSLDDELESLFEFILDTAESRGLCTCHVTATLPVHVCRSNKLSNYQMKVKMPKKQQQFGYSTHLKPFPDSLQEVGHQRVVPQVSEPNPRAFYIHGTGQEETGACGDKRTQMRSVVGQNIERPKTWNRLTTRVNSS